MGRTKPFADGGGLCSPGRWPADRRSKELTKSGKVNLVWVAGKVTRVDGKHPSTPSLHQFFAKVPVPAGNGSDIFAQLPNCNESFCRWLVLE